MPPACPVLQRSLLVLHGTPPKPQMLGPLAQAVALAQQYCPAPLGTAPGGVVRGQVQKFPVLDACPVAHVASAGKSARAPKTGQSIARRQRITGRGHPPLRTQGVLRPQALPEEFKQLANDG